MLQLVPRRKARSVRTFATRYPRPLDERISAHGWLQLRCRQVRGERAVGRGQLLPLQALPASQRNCSVGQRPSRIRHVSDRRRRGQAASLETRRRWGEMVLRRLWLFAVWPQPQPRRSNRHPHGNIRPRSRDPAKRPPVRRLRRTLGADPRRRTAPAPRKPPLSRLTVVSLGQPSSVQQHHASSCYGRQEHADLKVLPRRARTTNLGTGDRAIPTAPHVRFLPETDTRNLALLGAFAAQSEI